METEIIFQLLIAIWLWALIWMERWIKSSKKDTDFEPFWEIRTFWLISFLWAFLTVISIILKTSAFIIIWAFIVAMIILLYYAYWLFRKNEVWATTEIIWIVTFFLGSFVALGHYKISIILTIILTFLLSSKWFLDKITDKISSEELRNTIKFAVVSIVMLPLLPDIKYSILDIFTFLWYNWWFENSLLTLKFFNPYGIWFFVVLMSGISYVWYIMSKFVWEKWSILASGAIWWLVSSTAVTASMTERSKEDIKNINLYVVSTLLASTIMFIRVIVIVLLFNINLLSEIIIPSMFMLIGLVIYIIIFYIRWKNSKKIIKNIDNSKEYKSPFSIWPALKFAAFVILIKFVSGLWSLEFIKNYLWDYIYYGLWIISGLADVDAVSQTMAVDSKSGVILWSLAVTTIIIATISNNLVKWALALKFWEKRFGISVMLGFIVSMIMWIIWIFFMNLI